MGLVGGFVLASCIKKDFVQKGDRSFGIETMPLLENKIIEIWVKPKMKFPRGGKTGASDARNRKCLERGSGEFLKGVTWIFPSGKFSRFGIASYLGKTKIKPGLEVFLNDFGLKITDDLHGGFFPHSFRQPVLKNIFLVGDSGGHCLPLTGEGIRLAIYYGEKCGRIIQQIIDGKITLKEGQNDYSRFVNRKKGYYTFLSILEKLFITLPNVFAAKFAKFVSSKSVFKYAEKIYINLANLE